MGNRTMLSFGDSCEFEANNCVPVTWLALFDPQDFSIETRRFEYEKTMPKEATRPPRGLWTTINRLLGKERRHPSESIAATEMGDTPYEEAQVAVYQTSRVMALGRAESAIQRLEGRTPAWAYLRPLEILRDELQRCSSGDPVELDVTQFYWAGNPIYGQRILEGPVAFANMLDSLTGTEQEDIAVLTRFVDDYSMGSISSLVDLDPEDRMFVLIGTYWGERGDIYTLEYFGEAYWKTNT
jgi:hypothetical protein